MITKDQLVLLSKFQTGGYFVSSLYLNVDGRQFNKKDYEIKLKALIKDRKNEISGLGLNQEAQNSVFADFDQMTNFISLEFDGKGSKSLAIFSCSNLNLWQIFSLPQTIHPRLVVSKQPYIRPLIALLAENKKYFVILTSRDKARLFEYHMGNLQEHSQILNDVPSQVKMAGWYGLEERRIERRIEDHVHRHYKNVSEGVFNYYQNNQPDYFIIGGRQRTISEFESHLHSNIQEKIIARIRIDLEASLSDLALAIENSVQELESKEEKRKLDKLFEQQNPEGLSVTGLKATLRAIWNGQVRALFISEGYSKTGYYCPRCWFMSDNEDICANDQTPMKKSHDIIEDVIETAMFQNCEIIRVKNPKVLDGEHENIGALLRFKI